MGTQGARAYMGPRGGDFLGLLGSEAAQVVLSTEHRVKR